MHVLCRLPVLQTSLFNCIQNQDLFSHLFKMWQGRSSGQNALYILHDTKQYVYNILLRLFNILWMQHLPSTRMIPFEGHYLPLLIFVLILPLYLLCLHILEGFKAAGHKTAYLQEQFSFGLFKKHWVPPCIYGETYPQFNRRVEVYCMFCLFHILWRILLSRLRLILWPPFFFLLPLLSFWVTAGITRQ